MEKITRRQALKLIGTLILIEDMDIKTGMAGMIPQEQKLRMKNI